MLSGCNHWFLKIMTLFNMAIKTNNAAPRPSESRGIGWGDKSDLAGISEGERHDQFDGINWSKAAPSWASMFTGLVLPLLGLALLVGSVDLALSWLVERWASPSSMSPLLLAAIMFPPALIIAFGCCKLFLYFKDTMRTAARSGKREGAV
jgi:hypothetical protein